MRRPLPLNLGCLVVVLVAALAVLAVLDNNASVSSVTPASTWDSIGPTVGTHGSVACPTSTLCFREIPSLSVSLQVASPGGTFQPASLPRGVDSIDVSHIKCTGGTCMSLTSYGSSQLDLVVSNDAGTQWRATTPITPGTTGIGQIGWTCPDTRNCLVLSSAGNGTRMPLVFETENGGLTWMREAVQLPLRTFKVFQVTCATASRCFAIISADQPFRDFFIVTNDHGSTWRSRPPQRQLARFTTSPVRLQNGVGWADSPPRPAAPPTTPISLQATTVGERGLLLICLPRRMESSSAHGVRQITAVGSMAMS